MTLPTMTPTGTSPFSPGLLTVNTTWTAGGQERSFHSLSHKDVTGLTANKQTIAQRIWGKEPVKYHKWVSSVSSYERPNPNIEMWSYWQLFVVNNEQIRVGGLYINTGGQLNGLIGGLSWQITTNEGMKSLCVYSMIGNMRILTVIKADKTTLILKFIIEYIYRYECAAPDPRFYFHKEVALRFDVFKDAFDMLAFCTLTVLFV